MVPGSICVLISGPTGNIRILIQNCENVFSTQLLAPAYFRVVWTRVWCRIIEISHWVVTFKCPIITFPFRLDLQICRPMNCRHSQAEILLFAVIGFKSNDSFNKSSTVILSVVHKFRNHDILLGQSYRHFGGFGLDDSPRLSQGEMWDEGIVRSLTVLWKCGKKYWKSINDWRFYCFKTAYQIRP